MSLALLLAAAAQVAVTGGTVEGSPAPGGGALLFRGVPFAAPPTAGRRWRAPAPVVAWRDVRGDDADAPACMQNDEGWNRDAHLRSSEDCLTLDVRTPGLTGRRPVMVWIHGGSNRAGSARGTVLSRITDQGVVLVAIQYRLGIFGFLAHRGAAAEAGGTAGNYGLMDQIAALEWVRANIASFGGDPANVTVFGHSAGAQDTSLLLAAPAARGLFAKAIIQSGTPGFGMPFRSLASAFAIGDQAGASIAGLRAAPAAALLAADLELTDPGLPDAGFVWLNTVIDGAVLPRDPRALLAEAPPRPVILGTNRAEFGADRVDWPGALAAHFGANAARARALYRLDEPGRGEDARLGSAELQYGTDWTFRCPAGRLADLLAGRGAPVWRYELDLERNGRRSEHSSELPYVFDDLRFGGDVSVQRYWISFARTGDPNGGGQPHWPRFEPATQRHVLFDVRGVHEDARLREPLCSMLEAL